MKTSTILLVGVGAFVGLKILSTRKPNLTARPSQNSPTVSSNGTVAQFAGIANNLAGFASSLGNLFSATASGEAAPRNIGSGTSNTYGQSFSLGEYNLDRPVINGLDTTGAVRDATLGDSNSFQLQDTGLWASSSVSGGSPMPQYNGDNTFDFTF